MDGTMVDGMMVGGGDSDDSLRFGSTPEKDMLDSSDEGRNLGRSFAATMAQDEEEELDEEEEDVQMIPMTVMVRTGKVTHSSGQRRKQSPSGGKRHISVGVKMGSPTEKGPSPEKVTSVVKPRRRAAKAGMERTTQGVSSRRSPGTSKVFSKTGSKASPDKQKKRK